MKNTFEDYSEFRICDQRSAILQLKIVSSTKRTCLFFVDLFILLSPKDNSDVTKCIQELPSKMPIEINKQTEAILNKSHQNHVTHKSIYLYAYYKQTIVFLLYFERSLQTNGNSNIFLQTLRRVKFLTFIAVQSLGNCSTFFFICTMNVQETRQFMHKL